jgi:hypothetical protein
MHGWQQLRVPELRVGKKSVPLAAKNENLVAFPALARRAGKILLILLILSDNS